MSCLELKSWLDNSHERWQMRIILGKLDEISVTFLFYTLSFPATHVLDLTLQNISSSLLPDQNHRQNQTAIQCHSVCEICTLICQWYKFSIPLFLSVTGSALKPSCLGSCFLMFFKSFSILKVACNVSAIF